MFTPVATSSALASKQIEVIAWVCGLYASKRISSKLFGVWFPLYTTLNDLNTPSWNPAIIVEPSASTLIF